MTTVKPPIRGLLDRQGEPPKAMLPAVRAYVVKVNWADLQPVQGGPIVRNNAIDAALARVRDPKSPVHGLALKLRVFCGVQAPYWAKTLDGPALNYASTPDQTALTGMIGRFWTHRYAIAYADLQAKLAALYDSAPEIRELTLSCTTTFFDEPMVRNPIPANVTALLAAGYTSSLDKAAFDASISAHAVWKSTTTDIDFSPFPIIESTGYHGNDDMGFTTWEIQRARTLLGPLAGLQNNALSTDKLANKQFVQLYSAMKAAGGTIVFQTAASSRIGNHQQTLDAAVTYGAHSVELPQGYPAWGLPMLEAANSKLQ
jgi:hypothetical protein